MDLSWLRNQPLLAFDCETTGLLETDRPFGVAIASQHHSVYYDSREHENLWAELRPIFSDPNKSWIAHNAKFDIRMLASMGVYITGGVTDIMSMARLHRNNYLKYSLDAQAKRELNISKDSSVDAYIKEHGLYNLRYDFFGERLPNEESKAFDRVPIDIMRVYAAKDARLTFDLYKHYLKHLDSQSLDVLIQESALIPVCFKMERRGLLLDHMKTLEGMHHEIGLKERHEDFFRQTTGAHFVNSAKSLQKVLEFRLPTTGKGNPSLTDDVIDTVLTTGSSRDKLIGNTVRLIRGYDKRVSTYYRSYLNLKDKDNLIHASMGIASTKTGRFSYSDPNFQNMPKEEDSTDKYTIRGCIIPRPGHTFVSLDYSQMEYRMAVAYANQTDVITKVMAGADFHQATADLVGIKRSQAKTLNFAVLYGAGIDKIAGMLGCTKEEAKRLQFKYFSGMPKVETFIDRVISTGVGRGYVINWLGRRLYAVKEHCYALPNHLIQGGGADVVKKAMVEIDREFPNLLMVLQVHDQLVFELTPEEMQHVPRIKEIMETVFPPLNGMSLKVDVKVSRTSLAERDMEDYVL